jgi:hypothetical protein
MKVFKIELMVIDFDEVGQDGVRNVIENTKYPNRCIAPDVVSIEQREIEWDDSHPLNRAGSHDEFRRMFASEEPASAACNQSEGTAG